MEFKEVYKGKKIYKSTGKYPWAVQHSWASGTPNDLDYFSSLKKAKAWIDKMDAEKARG